MFRRRSLALRAAVTALATTAGLACSEGIVHLQWEPSASANVVGYRVYSRFPNQSWRLQAELGNQTRAEIAGLDEGRRYEFSVAAVNHYGQESAQSDPARTTVQQALALAWDAADIAPQDRFRLHLGTRSREYDTFVETEDTQFTLTGLRQGVTYYLAVTRLNRYGLESAPSPEVRFSSAPSRAFDRDPGVFIFYSFR